jgi:predicted nucleic acid-binding protein
VSPESYILDTSALLALIEDEAGADRVEQVLRHEQTFLPWVTLMEILYVTQQERGQAEAERRYALIKQSPARVLWDMDEPTLLKAARLKAAYHLSLADAIVAAVAIRRKAVLLHKDPEYEALEEHLQMENLPYKNA